MHTVSLPNGFEISDDRTRLDMPYVHRALATTFWAVDRPPAITERSWSNCLCFGLYDPAGPQRGFARLMTDYAMRAHLGDVFVDPAVRGRGLGKALVATIMAHPELATVHHWTLTTRDHHALYARFGFRLTEPDGRAMSLDRTPTPHCPPARAGL